MAGGRHSFFLLTSSGELAAQTTCTNQLERFFSSLVDLSDGKVRWDHSLSRHACVRMDDRDDDASFMWAQKVYSCHYASNALIGGMSYFFLSSSIISESCLTGIIAIVGHSRGAQPVRNIKPESATAYREMSWVYQSPVLTASVVHWSNRISRVGSGRVGSGRLSVTRPDP